MTPPVDHAALARILKTLPPERQDPFPHLGDLDTDQLLKRRVLITEQLKNLEKERQAIDAQLMETLSDAELRFGVRVPGGWMVTSRSRTSWDYAPEIRDAIKVLQKQAQQDGRAQPLVSTYLVATQEST